MLPSAGRCSLPEAEPGRFEDIAGVHAGAIGALAAAGIAAGTRVAGQVRERDASGQLRERGYLRLDIVEPDPDTLDTALRGPSPDRLSPLGDAWYVTDQVTVTLTDPADLLAAIEAFADDPDIARAGPRLPDAEGGVWCWGANRAGQAGGSVLETH